MKKILVFGAASAIAHETEKLFAMDGAEFYLADIKENRVKAIADDLTARNPKCKTHICEFNALNFDSHKEAFEDAVAKLGDIDIVFIAFGTLPDQSIMQTDNLAAINEFNLNATSIISLSTIAGEYFESKGKGCLTVISSVAGDRGRQSNYLYGAAKGAVSTFLQGLRNRLSQKGIIVLTIKPGMVDSPMTAHLPKSPLFAKTKDIGKGIYEAIKSEKDIAYLPGYWRLIMFVIKHIPEVIFKKMKL